MDDGAVIDLKRVKIVLDFFLDQFNWKPQMKVTYSMWKFSSYVERGAAHDTAPLTVDASGQIDSFTRTYVQRPL